MYVYLFVTSLQLKYTGLCIVYISFWHMPLMVSILRWRTRRIEGNGRLENEFRDIEDGNC